MFTASGLIVRFLKVFEKSNYHSIKWVRYLTKANGGYQVRVSWVFSFKSDYNLMLFIVLKLEEEYIREWTDIVRIIMIYNIFSARNGYTTQMFCEMTNILNNLNSLHSPLLQAWFSSIPRAVSLPHLLPALHLHTLRLNQRCLRLGFRGYGHHRLNRQPIIRIG